MPEVVSGHNTRDIRIAVKEALIEGNKDEMRIDDRKKNIVLFNVAESQSDSPVKRKKGDISFFLRLYNTICDDNSTEIVTDARRLGKPSEDDKKRRPLLITVDSEYTKRKCFSRLYRLKGD